MAETERDAERPEDAYRALLAHAERYADVGMAGIAAKLGETGHMPPDLMGSPLIIDTDVGSDPDDAVALAAAALATPELALVLTTDEDAGERARFARHLLDCLGRRDVPVVAGAQLPEPPPMVVGDLVPPHVSVPAVDVLAAVSAVVDRTDGPVRWLGIGPLTNLARVLTERPELSGRLKVTQMGGALRYRDPARAEHNFRRDPAAAAAVLAAADLPELIMSEHTFRPEIEITERSELYLAWSAPDAPEWARLLRAHHDAWFSRFHPGSMQHDALTLSVALRVPFVQFAYDRCGVDEVGRLALDPGGRPALLSYLVDYAAFMGWLIRLFRVTRHDEAAA